MSLRPSTRTRQNRNEVPVTPPSDKPEESPRVVAVFRRPDDTICHDRCGRQLALQGVRGLVEADFYCYTCLAHVSLPVSVLDELPIEPGDALADTIGHS
jgi:hypothetical protein